MVVNRTDWLGLAKPTEDELARNWVNNLDHVEANNNLLMNVMEIDLLSYTPTVTATTTPPNIGTGSRTGMYCDHQGIVFGNFIIDFLDAGITSGNGEYGISLPFPIDGSFHVVGTTLNANPGQYSVIGEGYMYDASAVTTSGAIALDVVSVAGVSYMRMITEAYTTPVKTSRFFRDSMPFAMAHQDRFTGNFIYKRA